MISASSSAQVATDGSLGPRVTFNGPNFVIPPTIGRASGPNLFHSFATMNVNNGQTLNFLGGSQIANIIARVTGGTQTNIDGQLSASTGVNLFLLNPSGIMFGPSASLNLTASFYASTGSHLVFADGSKFASSGDPTLDSGSLPFSDPSGFQFSGGRAPITLTGTQLVVRNGAALGLFGGDVRLTNSGTRLSILSVLGGHATIAATGGTADVALDGRATRGVSSGTLEALGGTIVAVNENASGNGSGRVVIRGGDVFFEKAQVLANSRLGDGRGIDIDAANLLSLKETSVLSLTTGRGNAGNINIRAKDLMMQDKSAIDTSCDPGCTTGRGGDISIEVQRNLVMTNDPKLGDQFIGSNSFGGGDTGRVSVSAQNLLMSGASAIQAVALSTGSSQGLTVNADTIVLSGGSQIDTSTRGSGQGGPLVVNAKDIQLIGDRLEGSKLADENDVLGRQSIPSGFFSNAYSSGFAGSITITTGSLRILDGGEISSSSARRAIGYGGLVRIVASGDVIIFGVSLLGATPKASAIVSNTFTSGDGGAIEITADRVQVLDRGLIQTQSEGSGPSGDIRVRARDMDVLGGQVSSDARAFGAGGTLDIRLTGLLRIARTDPNRFSGLFARTYSAAPGGSILVRARNIQIFSMGEINAGTIGAGRGGNISITVDERLAVNSGGKISSESDALGDAGDITVVSGQGIELSEATIFGRAKASDGGNVRISTQGPMTLAKGSEISAEVRAGTGAGGNVEITTGSYTQNGGRISASSVGGTGGNLTIRAGGALNTTDSTIAAQVASGIQNGGNVVLQGASISLGNSAVSANAFSGAGGSVSVQASGSVAVTNSTLNADVASGLGSGGNLTVSGGSLVFRQSQVSANTFSGTGGTLQLHASGGLLLDRSRVTAQVIGAAGVGGSIVMSASSLLLRNSTVSASALSGDGGNMTISSAGTSIFDTSRVSAEVLTGQGDGGNLDLEGGALLLRNSVVSANAYGGRGGNILIDSQNILTNSGSQVSASSELGIDGTVVFSSPAADLSGALFAVSSSFLDAAVAQGGVCAMPRSQGRASLALRVIDEDFGRREGFLFPAMSVEPKRVPPRVALLPSPAKTEGEERPWAR